MKTLTQSLGSIASARPDDSSDTPSIAAATGTSLGPTPITLQPNEDVVCTYTNVRRPSLTLVKVVTNDNGGTKTLSDFPLTATGPVTISGVSGESAVTGRTVDAGSYKTCFL